jgi:hypothetical protein
MIAWSLTAALVQLDEKTTGGLTKIKIHIHSIFNHLGILDEAISWEELLMIPTAA